DPYGEYLRPRFQGYRLASGVYQPIEEYPLRSTTLGLVLREEDNALRLYNPRTGERLRTTEEVELARLAAEAARNATMDQLEAEATARLEAEARAEQAARAAEEQTARAEAAEAELARLRALLEQRES
ncbi:MAG: Uma2 family endonuclease, partial [Roseiflexaceae bacterium]